MPRAARYKTNSRQFVQQLTTFEDSLTTLGARAVEQGAKMGAEMMQEIAEHSGTGWQGRGAGSPRSDTGEMIRDIDYDHRSHTGLSRKGGRVSRTARFGWINVFKDYFSYQDKGFVNLRKLEKNRGVTWQSGTGGPPYGETEGMEAYEQAHTVVKEWFVAEIDRITKTAWKRAK